jgi:hypothetical protein
VIIARTAHVTGAGSPRDGLASNQAPAAQDGVALPRRDDQHEGERIRQREARPQEAPRRRSCGDGTCRAAGRRVGIRLEGDEAADRRHLSRRGPSSASNTLFPAMAGPTSMRPGRKWVSVLSRTVPWCTRCRRQKWPLVGRNLLYLGMKTTDARQWCDDRDCGVCPFRTH